MKPSLPRPRPRRRKIDPAKFGLAHRFALIFALLVSLATVTVGYLVYRGARQSLIVASTDRLADTARIVEGRFNSTIETISKEVRFLSTTPPVEGLGRLFSQRRRGFTLDPNTAMSEGEWRQQLADVLTGFLESKPDYQSVRFIDLREGGREIVRVERRGERVRSVPRAALGSLGTEPYVAEAVKLDRGQLYFSEITFEETDNEGDEVPRLHAALPTFTADGLRVGLITLEIDLQRVFNDLDDLLTSDKSLYLANEQGAVLLAPDLPAELRRASGEPQDLNTLFPQLDELMERQADHVRIEQTTLGSGILVSAYFERMGFNRGVEANTLLLGITSPHALILGGVEQVRSRSLIITLFFSLSALLVAMLVSMLLTRPLSQVTRAISRFGRGAWAEELPVERGDEIGVLARTFVQMAEEIEGQVVELEDRERRQRTILTTSAEGIIVTDSEGLIETFNPAAESILGVEADAVLGHDVATLLRPPESAGQNGQKGTAWRQLGQGDEAIGHRPGGETVPLSVTWSSFTLGGETKYTILLQDITERKRAEALREQLLEELRHEQARLKELSASLEERVQERTADLARSNKALQQRNRELQDFAYVASHDLQEPLRKIRAFADLLMKDYGGKMEEEARFYIDRMQDSAGRMSRLITDLLAFSRVATKKRPFEPVDLNKILDAVCADLDILCKEHDGSIRYGPLPTLEADSTQIRQLLQNLVANALKFHRDGVPPVVHVRAVLDDDATLPGVDGPICRIEVEDNGIGFDEKYLERIFSPFQRLHGRSEYKGTGMGLTICRRIVERHEGTITAESTPGKGTTFIVHLPVKQREPLEEAVEETASA